LEVLETKVDKNSEEFKKNFEHYQRMVADLKSKINMIMGGGGSDLVKLHHDRGKLLARERIELLLDHNTPFLELNPLAAFDMYNNEAPSASIVTGIGTIHGRECMVIANDATVKGGTYYPMTVKKHIRAQEIAMENHLPCIYIVDSGGAFLPLQDEVFPDREHFGRIFYNQAKMSSFGIPQIAVVLGSARRAGPTSLPCPTRRS
jgi:3-methylcrotonyl-CoA carboxylase beta subunit/propionyl-CoA carboxylase